ncbi:phenylalanine racemase [Sutcliffiella rhizosphaerae]|uniref:Uncharacterized protein n=1 Tax=Sutcliffiella rhizosphaerae TaxID=2880967 RepID=A0ABM8YMB3_9BACI|nr:phenylalanine racemase [Sutcliffiella rhizosphaerae]CAG9621091.1 hypothetical protein BACCIP111883_01863 [Sutcliffiella rhizosphaerae]
MPNDQEETPNDLRLKKLAEPFLEEKELAFFVVHIGLSPKDYSQLTNLEKLFISKEYENKFISSTTWTRNAVLNGVANARRNKGKKFIDLFPKKQAKADLEYNENVIEAISRMENKNGKGWVDRVYEKLGFKDFKKGGE